MSDEGVLDLGCPSSVERNTRYNSTMYRRTDVVITYHILVTI